MSLRPVARRPRTVASLTLASLLCVAHVAHPTPTRRRAPTVLPTTPGVLVRMHDGQRADYVARPRTTASEQHPVALYIHGLCGEPGNGCRYLRESVDPASWLVCPSAPVPCAGGGGSWGAPGAVQRATLQQALTELSQRAPGEVNTETPGVVIGFSQGAYVVQSLLHAWPGRFHGAVFIGAYVNLTRAELDAAGIRRVVLAAARNDGSHATMVAATARLAREGFDARFEELGDVGHSYAHAGGPSTWRNAMAWVSGG